MGILNVTPDSFYDGGRYTDPRKAIQRAKEMISQGADILDIGGESTRPGAEPVSPEIELSRVLPIIKELAKEVEVPISIDTYKASVAAAALSNGAAMVNDISGLRFDSQMSRVIAEFQVPVVIMHTLDRPQVMQERICYHDLMQDIIRYLKDSIDLGISAGISADMIIVDPGLGFGKEVSHNLTILRDLRRLEVLAKPIMIGASRKSFIGRVLDLPLEERLIGSLAAAAIAIFNGANIIRTHDVEETRQVARMVDAIMGKESA